MFTCPVRIESMYFEGKSPANPKRPPWKIPLQMLMMTTVERVTTRKPDCHASVSSPENTDIKRNKLLLW